VADDVGFNEPAPFEVIVTDVAVPPKLLPVTFTDVVPHVLPVMLPSMTVGGLIHPHDTEKGAPKVTQPEAFLTVIK
jgi:hypothetical protein